MAMARWSARYLRKANDPRGESGRAVLAALMFPLLMVAGLVFGLVLIWAVQGIRAQSANRSDDIVQAPENGPFPSPNTGPVTPPAPVPTLDATPTPSPTFTEAESVPAGW